MAPAGNIRGLSRKNPAIVTIMGPVTASISCGTWPATFQTALVCFPQVFAHISKGRAGQVMVMTRRDGCGEPGLASMVPSHPLEILSF